MLRHPKFGILGRGDFMNTWEADTVPSTFNVIYTGMLEHFTHPGKVSSCFGA